MINLAHAMLRQKDDSCTIDHCIIIIPSILTMCFPCIPVSIVMWRSITEPCLPALLTSTRGALARSIRDIR